MVAECQLKDNVIIFVLLCEIICICVCVVENLKN
jgi:hypothetical protein